MLLPNRLLNMCSLLLILATLCSTVTGNFIMGGMLGPPATSFDPNHHHPEPITDTTVNYFGNFECLIENRTWCAIAFYREYALFDNDPHLATLPFYCTNQSNIYHHVAISHQGCDKYYLHPIIPCFDWLHEPFIRVYHNCSLNGRTYMKQHELPEVLVTKQKNGTEHSFKMSFDHTYKGKRLWPYKRRWSCRTHCQIPDEVHAWLHSEKNTSFVSEMIDSPYVDHEHVISNETLEEQKNMLREKPKPKPKPPKVTDINITYTGIFECGINSSYCFFADYREWALYGLSSHFITGLPFFCTDSPVVEHQRIVHYKGCDSIEWEGVLPCLDYNYEPFVAVFHNCSVDNRMQMIRWELPEVDVKQNETEFSYSINLVNDGSFRERRMSSFTRETWESELKLWINEKQANYTMDPSKWPYFNVTGIQENQEDETDDLIALLL
uniref:Glycoprotein n=1 Tax=Caenorhabditis tropicalis TaxID=1561998 RepID=A0A1I7UPP1_9PELO